MANVVVMLVSAGLWDWAWAGNLRRGVSFWQDLKGRGTQLAERETTTRGYFQSVAGFFLPIIMR